MSRFRQGGDETLPYSVLHPERFEEPQQYEPPREGVVRAIDDAPTVAELERAASRGPQASLGYAGLKRRL